MFLRATITVDHRRRVGSLGIDQMSVGPRQGGETIDDLNRRCNVNSTKSRAEFKSLEAASLHTAIQNVDSRHKFWYLELRKGIAGLESAKDLQPRAHRSSSKPIGTEDYLFSLPLQTVLPLLLDSDLCFLHLTLWPITPFPGFPI
jgi:hypothetical protein